MASMNGTPPVAEDRLCSRGLRGRVLPTRTYRGKFAGCSHSRKCPSTRESGATWFCSAKPQGVRRGMRRTLCIYGPYSQFLHRMKPRPQIHNRTFGFRTGKRQGPFFGVSIGLRMRGRGHRGRAGHHLLQAVVRIVMIYVLRGYELMLDKYRRRHVPLI